MIQVDFSQPGQSIQIEDGLTDTSTSLTLIGKNYKESYSKPIAENFLHLLENFASSNEPTKKTRGQLWYDISNQTLKVYDNTNWVPIAMLEKSTQPPVGSSSLTKGDLYVDTTKSQLYIYNGGENWTLIGPQSNAIEKTSAEVELLTDASTNTIRPVLTMFVKTRRVAIVSDTEFTPKTFLDGFKLIKQGFNLSTTVFDSTSKGTKFWGISEKAESLVVGDEVVGSKNFLRLDQTSTTNYAFNVRSNSGVSIGNDLIFTLGTDSGGGFLSNKKIGSTIDVRLRKANQVLKILRVHPGKDNDPARGAVGINVLNPQESLDVDGNIKTNSKIIVSSTLADSISTDGSVIVGNNLNVSGLISSHDIDPMATGVYNLGNSSKKWANIYINSVQADSVGKSNGTTAFNGVFTGDLTGDVNGTCTGLAQSITLNLAGDVTSTSVSLQNGNTSHTFTTTLKPTIISSRTESTNLLDTDIFLIERENLLYKIKKSTLNKSLATMPVGSIILFSGSTSNIPNGYLLCDGTEIPKNQYLLLFGVIGYTYKDQADVDLPNGFALPDLTTESPISGTNYIIYTGKLL